MQQARGHRRELTEKPGAPSPPPATPAPDHVAVCPDNEPREHLILCPGTCEQTCGTVARPAGPPPGGPPYFPRKRECVKPVDRTAVAGARAWTLRRLWVLTEARNSGCSRQRRLFFSPFSQMAQANYSHLCSTLHLCRLFSKCWKTDDHVCFCSHVRDFH